MSQTILSKRKSEAISNGSFLVGLGILFYTNAWWPGILLVLWIALVLRQALTGRNYDAVLSSIILLGLFLMSYVKIDWSVLIPILFVVGGIYLIFKEYFYADESIEDSINETIEDHTEMNKKD